MYVIDRLIGQQKPKIPVNVFCALLHEYVRGNVTLQALKAEAEILQDKRAETELLKILQWLGSAPFAKLEQLRHCLILGEAGIYKTSADVETALKL